MWRHHAKPRDDWQKIVTKQGLIYPVTPKPDGTVVNYWNESAWYEFTMAEILRIEAATEELWGMSMEAVSKMARDMDDSRLGLPQGTLEYAKASIRRGDPSVYGRFDLQFEPTATATGDDVGTPKLLELNGDTPTGLIETGVAQWFWLQDEMPGVDQFNSVHERLLERWIELKKDPNFPASVHFLWNDSDDSGEEEMTTHYMRDLAAQAGIQTYGQPISKLQWDYEAKQFYDALGQPVECAYKLYPWENMLADEFGPILLHGMETKPMQWIEPAWKVLLSTKALLPVLWEMFPDHEFLLPAYFDAPADDMLEWVAKPLHGREGDNIKIHTLSEDIDLETADGGYGAEGYVYQQWCPLPSMDGHRPMLGSWIIGGQAAGMIVRESDGPVTDYYSRVVPHAISDALEPDDAQRAAWLAERIAEARPTVEGTN